MTCERLWMPSAQNALPYLDIPKGGQCVLSLLRRTPPGPPRLSCAPHTRDSHRHLIILGASHRRNAALSSTKACANGAAQWGLIRELRAWPTMNGFASGGHATCG